MKVLNFKDFMKKNYWKDNTVNEFELQRVYNYPIYTRYSKIYSDEGFVNNDNGSQGGSHWTSFIVKVTNHTTSIVLVVSQIHFYLIKNLNK